MARAKVWRCHRETIVYDAFERPGGYKLADYAQKWTTTFGPGEMAAEDTRRFADGKFSVSAVPFRTSADFSVFDHIKYFAASTRSFEVPRKGSITFTAQIDVQTPGTQPGRVIHGSYGPARIPTGRHTLRRPSKGSRPLRRCT